MLPNLNSQQVRRFLTSLIRKSDRMVTGRPENVSDTVCDEWLTVLWFEKMSFKQTVAKFDSASQH